MRTRTVVVVVKVLFALLGFSAIVTEIAASVERGVFNPGNFFSYFTVESNIFAVAALLIGAFALAARTHHVGIDLFRGLAALCMVTTGIVFALLLAPLENTQFTAVPWDNIVLHYIMPVVLLVDWLVDPPRPIPYRLGLIWLAYPLAYLAYSLIRGPIVGWYPYPFMNPDLKGWGAVALTSVGIAAFVAGLSWVLCRLTRRGGLRVADLPSVSSAAAPPSTSRR